MTLPALEALVLERLGKDGDAADVAVSKPKHQDTVKPGFQQRRLLVYLKVLQQQQKHDTALAVLQGPLGNLFTITTDCLCLQGERLMHSLQYEHAN
ncbi:unnamed protein product [Sphagnum jensenii]